MKIVTASFIATNTGILAGTDVSQVYLEIHKKITPFVAEHLKEKCLQFSWLNSLVMRVYG